MSAEENPFEELCRLASLNRWCWKVPCTTCRNHHLSAGLALIAHGVPLAKWDHATTRWPEELIPSAKWPHELPGAGGVVESERLGVVLSAANLESIRENYYVARRLGGREDWLGYLGVVLVRTKLSPPHLKQVGKSWRVQLNRMAGSIAPDTQPVTFGELETYERLLLSGEHPKGV